MISLRRRLTISYTVLVGGFIALVAVVLTWLAFEAVVQPLKGAIESYAREAHQVAAAEPYVSGEALVKRLRSVLNRPDIVIIARQRPSGLRGPIGAFGGFGGPLRQFGGTLIGPGGAGTGGEHIFSSGAEPGFGSSAGPGLPAERSPLISRPYAPPGLAPDGRFSGQAGDFAGGAGPRFDLSSALGLRPTFVHVGTVDLIIAADRPVLESRVRWYLFTLFGALIVSFVAAWLLARWIAAQAVQPLIAVTGELQRFAAGDFTPRSVQGGDVSDVGALIEAYNGAAAQVSAAFEERGRAEERMRRFLADAGHELRTPLSIVTAYIEVLRKGGVDDAGLRDRAFSTLAAETMRMRRLVERLVALARLESPETTQPVVVDLGALAGDAVEAIVAARGVAGNVLADAESGAYVRADPADLHEAITNLIDNAIKYGDGSLVRVTVRHEQGAVSVRVSDCGPGIPPADREKIFERFYRSAEQQTTEGSGLGLAIAKRAAARAGGELELERTGDRETVFRLRLPLHVAGELGEDAGTANQLR
jgi:signal transduction histidine kinase